MVTVINLHFCSSIPARIPLALAILRTATNTATHHRSLCEGKELLTTNHKDGRLSSSTESKNINFGSAAPLGSCFTTFDRANLVCKLTPSPPHQDVLSASSKRSSISSIATTGVLPSPPLVADLRPTLSAPPCRYGESDTLMARSEMKIAGAVTCDACEDSARSESFKDVVLFLLGERGAARMRIHVPAARCRGAIASLFMDAVIGSCRCVGVC